MAVWTESWRRSCAVGAIAASLGCACRHAPAATTGPDPNEPSTPTDTAPVAPPTETVLSVSSYRTGTIHLFDPVTGAPASPPARVEGLDGAQTVAVDADGQWVACAELRNQIVRLDPVTFTEVAVVVGDDPATADDETGGLLHPDGATFGPDGRLYVSSFDTDQVLRYEADGTFVDVFVDAGVGGLDGPDIGIVFAPNGDLLVPGWYSDRVHRYDGVTGEPKDDLVGAVGGLDAPRAIVPLSTGDTLVSAWGTPGVLRIAADGAVSQLVDWPRATGMVVDEAAGVILLANDGDNGVRAFALDTGRDLGVRATDPEIDGATSLSLLTRPVPERR